LTLNKTYAILFLVILFKIKQKNIVNMLSNFTNATVIFLSLITASGVFVHDTRIDKVAATAATLPSALLSYESNDKLTNVSSDSHVSTERSSLAQAVRDLQSTMPRIQPRTEDKKHLMQVRIMRGHHPFDGYHLPQ
jgi:hypothetical protein